jgi:hypothetical protein
MMWCDTRVLPWIFTKVTINAYWGPGAAYDLIWMITYGPSAYDGYYWSPGGWVFTLGDQYTPGTTLLSSYLYRTNNPAYPPYLLAPKQVRLPYQYDGDSGQNYVLLTQRGCPDPQGQQALPPVGTYDWRVHMAYSANIAPQWLQGGKLEAIRVDYWENTGGGTPMAPWGLRESWYFVKNIGVVRILAKEFGAANLCAHDRDCFAADIQSPHVQVELQSYRTN